MVPDSTELVGRILNAAWMVRHYRRGIHHTGWLRTKRAEAIHELGLACRDAFNRTEDFEALLAAICDGLLPHEPRF